MAADEHEMRVTYAGFHCTCDRWRVGSINDPDGAFAKHLEALRG